MKTSIKTIGILTSGGDAPGLNATIRKSRGEDIFAACGLLSSERNKEATNHPEN